MSDMPGGVSTPKLSPEESAIKKLIASNQDLQDAMESAGMGFQDVIKKFDESKEIEKKQNEETTEYFENTKNSLKENYENLKKSTFEAISSPLTTLMNPLKEYFGIDLGGIFSSLKEDVDKKGKKNPSEADVVKTGKEGTNTMYLSNKLEELLKPEEEGMGGGIGQFLSGLGGGGLGNLVSKALPMLGKFLGIGSLIAGLAWAIFDGVKGFFLSDEWGASKISSALAGFFAGTGEGWKGAFANAGKWALIGAGAGFLIGGPLGALVGGLGGAVVGGLLGFFGGKNVAGFFDKIPGFLKSIWESQVLQTIFEWVTLPFMAIKDAFAGLIDDFKAIWTNEEDSVAKKIGKTIGKIFFIVPDLLMKFFGSLFKRLKDFGKNRKEILKAIGLVILKLIIGIGKLIVGAFKFMKNIPSLVKEKLLPAVSSFFTETFIPMVKDIFAGLKEAVLNNPLMKGIIDIVFGTIDWIKDFFGKIKEGFSNFLSNPVEFAKDIMRTLVQNVKNFFSTIGDFFSFIGEVGFLDLVKIIAKGEFSDTFDKFKEGKDKKRYYKDNNIYNEEFNPKGTVNHPNPMIRTVDDAIITKTGDIIKTSPEDNIIATKLDPKKIMSTDRSLPNKTDKILLQLIDVINMLAEKIESLKPQIITNVVRPIMTDEDLTKFVF